MSKQAKKKKNSKQNNVNRKKDDGERRDCREMMRRTRDDCVEFEQTIAGIKKNQYQGRRKKKYETKRVCRTYLKRKMP